MVTLILIYIVGFSALYFIGMFYNSLKGYGDWYTPEHREKVKLISGSLLIIGSLLLYFIIQ
ncbi:hypothetical protein ML462_11005 [Gramella lutea]|uniref:Uncharacterized protein n=1 Tax=Christiangramia lutea TaxID=1607951 RepID=A0A9X1V3Y1_9FLAO|nr:hypothetical protein [Christiangramia lutea]MCH4823698.1 hypothetical protein [Christiangramia lutea]